jgi:hypothetical protein
MDVPNDAIWPAVRGAMTLIAADTAWNSAQGSATCVPGHLHNQVFFLLVSAQPPLLLSACACLTTGCSGTASERALTGSQEQGF